MISNRAERGRAPCDVGSNGHSNGVPQRDPVRSEASGPGSFISSAPANMPSLSIVWTDNVSLARLPTSRKRPSFDGAKATGMCRHRCEMPNVLPGTLFVRDSPLPPDSSILVCGMHEAFGNGSGCRQGRPETIRGLATEPPHADDRPAQGRRERTGATATERGSTPSSRCRGTPAVAARRSTRCRTSSDRWRRWRGYRSRWRCRRDRNPRYRR